MQSVRSGSPVPVKPTGRIATGRRIQAARLMAGDPPLHMLARDGGLSYRHLLGVVNGKEPLLDTDAVALGELLGVPGDWLRHGWHEGTA